jgi:hypothetical protein
MLVLTMAWAHAVASMFGDPALTTVQPAATEPAPQTILATEVRLSSAPCPVKAAEEPAAEERDVSGAFSQMPIKKDSSPVEEAQTTVGCILPGTESGTASATTASLPVAPVGVLAAAGSSSAPGLTAGLTALAASAGGTTALLTRNSAALRDLPISPD